MSLKHISELAILVGESGNLISSNYRKKFQLICYITFTIWKFDSCTACIITMYNDYCAQASQINRELIIRHLNVQPEK
jgi:hypothetical protein